MRKIRKSALLVLAFMLMTCLAMPVDAAEISRASLPSGINAESAQIVENLISDVLEEVKNGLGYAEAWGKANEFVFYAIADGLFAILSKCKQGIADMLKKKAKSMQLSFLPAFGFLCP